MIGCFFGWVYGWMFILAVFAVEFKVFMVKWWYEFGSGWECFSAVRC